MAPLERWKPPEERTLEDKLLHQYWHAAGGLIFTEVVVGIKGPAAMLKKEARLRRIDGVRVCDREVKDIPPEIITYSKSLPKEFDEAVNGAHVEIIEIKERLGRNVMGQVIIGTDLFEMDFKPTKIDQVILCQVGDPLLEVICQRRGIKVWISKGE